MGQTKQRRAVPEDKALLAIQLLLEGTSVRSTERITQLHRDTILEVVRDHYATIPAFDNGRMYTRVFLAIHVQAGR
jgi:hypothetical protein